MGEEVFQEGIQAKKLAAKVMRQPQPSKEDCAASRVHCEDAFRTMRDCYMMDCREQTRSCNRLRDLLTDVQLGCEDSFKRCRKDRQSPGALWQLLLPGDASR